MPVQSRSVGNGAELFKHRNGAKKPQQDTCSLDSTALDACWALLV
jgi:hypothetical protein